MEKLHDKVSGLGIVRFDKPHRTITIECWPFLADPLQPGTQFRGWPVTIGMLDNYGRKPAAKLAQARHPRQRAARCRSDRRKKRRARLCPPPGRPAWQPHVFAPGKYTVRISEPETGKSKELAGLEATAANDSTLQVQI